MILGVEDIDVLSKLETCMDLELEVCQGPLLDFFFLTNNTKLGKVTNQYIYILRGDFTYTPFFPRLTWLKWKYLVHVSSNPKTLRSSRESVLWGVL